MPDPQLQEFCGVGSLQTYRPDVFRRHQRYVRDVVQPQLEERDALLIENADLREKLEKLSAKAAGKKAEAVPA